MQYCIEEAAIRRVINRFANCFDLKAWDEMQGCLTESLYTDYSDLRGTPPETMSNARFVELRKAALDAMSTHHIVSNHNIEIEGDSAKANVASQIKRRNREGEVLDTYCLYRFGLSRTLAGWQISAIVQKVYWSDGNRRIHSGVVMPRPTVR